MALWQWVIIENSFLDFVLCLNTAILKSASFAFATCADKWSAHRVPPELSCVNVCRATIEKILPARH